MTEQNISVATTEMSKYCRKTLGVLGIVQAFHLPHLVREPPRVSQNKEDRRLSSRQYLEMDGTTSYERFRKTKPAVQLMTVLDWHPFWHEKCQ